ncbi:Fcf2 pre-rRNA processing-domain-containing protein [Suillus clintonianus]|uniref:Fcf2 pre-rRNA processing-domain-containing protein n=1 Tax=Suillus clintonianus TaxID=1904413 RepID=UPI001B86C611|nr:Fcf2 pre-rRNA processing-domain-containing protein [Suillus clintonianus]KAG2151418.1 Fcf2 pre-rRNA processing-domain-containing protein [Suillus clintonianus]
MSILPAAGPRITRTLVSEGSSPSGSSSNASSDSDSGSGSDSDSDSDSDDEEITQEYLQSLLDKAKSNARQSANLKKALRENAFGAGEDIIKLGGDDSDRPLPPLDPGELPPAYFEFVEGRRDAPATVRDPDIQLAEAATSGIVAPAPPPKPMLTGKMSNKKQRRAMRNQTAGPSWFDLPAPAEADLPRLHREVEALRLRNQLDPKRFYRKDDGDGKGIKGLPKHFAIGTIVTTNTPFGTASTDNLPRAHRKRTFVDELVDDAEARRYAKRKFEDLQAVRGARGKNTLHQKQALRRPKW